MIAAEPQGPLAVMDFYRTLPADLTAKSKSGGFISVGTLVVIFMLLWAEIGNFFSERKYSTIMVERITGHDKIGLNINMTVHDYGCHSLFLKYRTRTKGYLIDKVDESKLAFEDDHHGGCTIIGETAIVKVPGYLEIALRKAGSKEVSLPHTIEHLYLGDNIFLQDDAVWHDDIPEIVFNPLRDHDEKLADPGMDTEYHLQLVHTALQLQRNGELADPYQYSYTTKSVKSKKVYPSVKFFFDWSPITIKYGIKNYYYSDLGGRLIATIGGCFTIAMFLHTFLITSAQAVIARVSPMSSTKLGA